MLSKFSGTKPSGGKTSGGNVTVVDARFYRSSARNAKVAFYLTAIIVGLLAAVIAADRVHPILALFYGALIGIPLGAVVWAVVRIWPILRLIWWWLPEILLASGLVYGWTVLAQTTNTAVMAVVVAVVVGVPAAVGPVRRRIIALAWCLIVRHRLRTCFAQFITANKSGSLPLIGIARLTPVGERVTIYLRPGLSMADLQSQLDRIAVGCRAATVTVERASATNAARVRIDIKRREVLTATVESPLVNLVDATTDDMTDDELDPTSVATAPTLSLVPTALDLPDVVNPNAASSTASTKPMFGSSVNANSNGSAKGRKAPSPNGTNGAAPAGSGTSTADADDDVSQWI